ncbi:MAG: cell division protein FtsW [Proteobacteria bacterium]|nr:cell division protein FtsW [Pseudomonadota bacterium]
MLGRRGSDSIRKWWWGVDLLSVLMLITVMLIGAILITTASPAVADRVRLPPFHFVYKHFFFLSLSLIIMFYILTFSEVGIKRLALVGFLASLALMVLVLFFGDEAKGAKRWINLGGFSLQPSELIKPFMATIIGLVLSEGKAAQSLVNVIIIAMIYLLVATFLILQPDFGMTMSITIVTAGQLFIAGLSVVWIVLAGVCGIGGIVAAYVLLPHVAKRINSFISPEESENYQVSKSLEAYLNGGLLGRGPGEGSVKASLPDSHTDFIFAVAGEEFGGLFVCMVIALLLTIVWRGLLRLSQEYNLFHIYAGSGILLHFAFQSIFNIGVTLHLFPTKGMTLPFISYGGSSMLSFGIAMGIYLNLSKRRYGYNLRPNRQRVG